MNSPSSKYYNFELVIELGHHLSYNQADEMENSSGKGFIVFQKIEFLQIGVAAAWYKVMNECVTKRYQNI